MEHHGAGPVATATASIEAYHEVEASCAIPFSLAPPPSPVNRFFLPSLAFLPTPIPSSDLPTASRLFRSAFLTTRSAASASWCRLWLFSSRSGEGKRADPATTEAARGSSRIIRSPFSRRCGNFARVAYRLRRAGDTNWKICNT